MALVVGVNTYGLEAEADAYFSERTQGSFWQSLTNKAAALTMGFRHLNSMFEWRGSLTSKTQKGAFPRTDLVDDEGREYDPDEIPEEVFWAQCELAGQWAQADQLMPLATYLTSADPDGGAQLKSKQLGSMRKEYFENAQLMFSLAEGRMKTKVYPLVDLYVMKFAYERKDGSGLIRLMA